MIVWTLLHEKLICLMILADHWSTKSADLTVFARFDQTQYIRVVDVRKSDEMVGEMWQVRAK